MIAQFLQYKKQVEGCANGTIMEYEKNLRAFATWTNQNHPGTRWSTLTTNIMSEHISQMTSAGLKPRTIKLRVSSVRSLLNWLCAQGMLRTNPLRYQQTPKPGTQLPKIADVDAVTQFVTAETISPTTIEIQALVSLLAETGIRIGEAVNIHTQDINKKDQSIIIRGKGNKERLVYYGAMTKSKVNALAKVKNLKYIIFSRTPEDYRALMTREMKPYINYIHPHMLRHTYATTMLNNGASLSAIAANLGHESTRMSERYAHLAESAAKHAGTQLALRL